MKSEETNDKKLDEFLTASVVKQVKAQGFAPLEVTGVDIGTLELDMKNGTYGELSFVSLFCKSRTSDNEKYLAILPVKGAANLAAMLLNAVAKIKEEEGE